MEKKALSETYNPVKNEMKDTNDEGLVLTFLYPGFIIAVLVYCLIYTM